jgi:RNA polymerase sigma-70 factor (ECF subfamily)
MWMPDVGLGPSVQSAGSVPSRTDLALESFREGLVGYCYRMLASPFDAEDAVQETMLRAWRNLDRFDERRAPLRSWIYAIATNVCFDMLRHAARRSRAFDLGSRRAAGADLGMPLADAAWVEPIPDSLLTPASGDPAEVAAHRDTVRLAFVAALQYLPPRQRAVLILRDVLAWTSKEVADLLSTSVASVTSLLQRARSALKRVDSSSGDLYRPLSEEHQELLGRYCDAIERDDVDALISLLHEDATLSMPPFAWWLQGRPDIRRALMAPDQPCRGARLLPTVANASPAFGLYRPTVGSGYEAFGLVVLEIAGRHISDVTIYLAAERMFPMFALQSNPTFSQRLQA